MAERVFEDLVVVKDGSSNRRRVLLDAGPPRVTVTTPGEVREGNVGTTTSDATVVTQIEPAEVVLAREVFGPPENQGRAELDHRSLRFSGNSESAELARDGLVLRQDSGALASLQPARLGLSDAEGRQAVELDGRSSRLRLGAEGRGVTVHIDGRTGNVTLGGRGKDGDLLLLDHGGNLTIGLNGESGNAVLGGHGKDGDVRLLDNGGAETVRLDGQNARALLGGGGTAGEVRLRDASGAVKVILTTDAAADWPVADGEAAAAAVDLVGELHRLKERVIELEAQVAVLTP